MSKFITGEQFSSGVKQVATKLTERMDSLPGKTIINDVTNPLTTEPLEYGYFKASKDVSNLTELSTIPFDTIINGNMDAPLAGVFTLRQGIVYEVEFDMYALLASYNDFRVECYNVDNNEVLIKAGKSPSTNSKNMTSTVLKGIVVSDKSIRVGFRTSSNIASLYSEYTYAIIKEYRNNPVNQYGGFETEVLFDGNLDSTGSYKLADSSTNYDYFVFSKKTQSSSNLVPTLTGNSNDENYIVTSSALKEGYPYYAFNSATGYWYSSVGVESWLQIKLKNKTEITGFWCQCASTSGSAHLFFPKEVIFEGSNDGVSYETITEVTFPLVSALAVHTVKLDKSANYSIYRWRFKTSYAVDSSNNPLFQQMQLLGSPSDFIQSEVLLSADVKTPFSVFDSKAHIKLEDDILTVGRIGTSISKITGVKGQLPSLLCGGEF